MRVRLKPREFEARPWDGKFEGEVYSFAWTLFCLDQARKCPKCRISLGAHGKLRGTNGPIVCPGDWILTNGPIVCPGDWILTDDQGKQTVCEAAKFAETYDEV